MPDGADPFAEIDAAMLYIEDARGRCDRAAAAIRAARRDPRLSDALLRASKELSDTARGLRQRTFFAPPPDRPRSGPRLLSPTQLRVARLADHTADEIAAQLHMSPRTVRAHLNAARGRLGVAHKRFIVRALAERGLDKDPV